MPQRLQERASILRFTHIACLAYYTTHFLIALTRVPNTEHFSILLLYLKSLARHHKREIISFSVSIILPPSHTVYGSWYSMKYV
jgi:hypothetical protein